MSVLRVGRSAYPLICVDGFSGDPDALVTLAWNAPFIAAGSVYPGVRAPAPAAYVSNLLGTLAGEIHAAFGAAPDPGLELCAFSMVTTAPAALRPLQRIPHFDGPEPARIAFVHYLCAPAQGGTSFYRHRATELERVTAARVDAYRECVAGELAREPPRGDYAGEDARHFERIHQVPAAFDRLIVYPGNALHSGDIGPGTVLDEDPRRGRLTINGFGFLRS